ncbi:MAG: ABC transporter substrate binding protein [Victivallaceae bacterium]|nr:ABC transporter substrate binding protein [Victivallaceae bacterium]
MKKQLGRFAALLLVVICMVDCKSLCADVTYDASDSASILLVSSYSGSYKWTNDQNTGFRRFFNEHARKVSIDTVELNTEEKPGFAPSASDIALLKEQIKRQHYNVIVAADNQAADLFIDRVVDVPDHVPVVFLGYTEFPKNDPRLRRPGITGLLEEDNYCNLIKFGRRLFPNTRHVMLVTDGSTSGVKTAAKVESEVAADPALADIEFISINGANYSTAEMLEKLNSLPPDSFLIFQKWLSTRPELREYRTVTVQKIYDACKVPVFGNLATTINDTVIGGVTTLAEPHGYEAAAVVDKILSGTPAESIPARSGSMQTVFNYKLLNKYNIPMSKLPPDALIINRPADFLTCYRGEIFIAGICVCVLLIAVAVIGVLLLHNKRNVSRLLDALPIRIVAFTRNGKIVFIHAADWLKRHPEIGNPQNVDQLPNTMFLPLQEAREKLAANGGPVSFEYSCDNERRRCELVKFDNRLFGATGTFLMISTNIDQLFEARKSLLAALSRAESANRAKSAFLATVSHELRTPLNAVIGYSELLQDESLKSADRLDYVRSINLAGNSLLNLINDVLDLSKIEADCLKIVPSDTNLKLLADEMLAVFKRKAEARDVDFKTDFAEYLPILRLDALRLRQILLNLIGNALKYTEHGTVTLRAKYNGSAGAPGRLELTVSDTGVGIAPERQTAIFEPFEQADDARDRHTGTGLGLAIVSRLVVKMGGVIRLDSAPGRGSNFIITLENVVASESRTEVEKPRPPAAVRLDGFLFMVVDDSPVNLKLLQVMLAKFGGRVITAESAGQALDMLRTQTPDCVLTDLWMPGMSGAELAAAIRRESKLSDMRLVAVTADTEFRLTPEFDGYLLKPVTLHELAEVMTSLRLVRHG